ncbi:MAG: FAD:protein FMN transferase [Halobacteriovoraceae bacterium]|nr:FAD:protein FMN transferase [Halobacteriovoraceae bacterium]
MKNWAFGLALISVLSCNNTDLIHLKGRTMGTTYNIKFKKSDKSTREIQDAIDQKLADINNVMSTYIENSELSRINQSLPSQRLSISSELFAVLQMSKTIFEKSDGAFDITVGPLVNLWGFGPQKKIGAPSDKEVLETLKYVGMNKLEINENFLIKNHPKLYIDLSAIAKGYGVDQVANVLHKQFDINDFMIEIGGEMSLRGFNNNRKWKIAIEKPSTINRDLQRILEISDIAIATSGSYRNFFKYKDKTYSHTINPHSGYPVKHKLVSVTVLDTHSCMKADAWATALSVLGPDQGFELATKLGIAAYFLYESAGQIVSSQTPAFSNAIQ